MTDLRFIRDQVLAENIVIVDGMSKSGKSLVLPLISSLSNGELFHYDYLFEYLATFHHLGKMDYHATASLMKLYADHDLYNIMIGRETNLRKADSSGAFANLLEARQKKRMAGPEGEAIIRQIRSQNPILTLMVHYVFQASDVFFKTFGDRLRLYLITMRHPAWLVEGWSERDWNKRFNISPRDFQLCVKVNGKVVPWFIADNDPGYYLSLNALEQAVYVVDCFTKSIEKKYKQLSPALRNKVMIIPFELFAAKPAVYMKRIAQKTKSKLSAFTGKMLKHLDLPRPFQVSELRTKRNQIAGQLEKKKAPRKIREIFDVLCRNYEQKYLYLGAR